MKGGAVCFLSKPFDEAALLECVKRTLKPDDAADDGGQVT